MSYIGNDELGGMFLGSVEIEKAYLGNTLVYDSLPYIPLEYIQTDGTAYINTGIMGKQPLSYKVKALFVGDGVLLGKGRHYAMGGGTRVTATMIPVIVSNSNAGFTYQYTYSVLNISSKIGVEPVLYEAHFAQRNRTVNVKGESDEEWTTRTLTSNLGYSTQTTPMYLFRNNYSSNPEQCGNGTRLYYCKIYNTASFTSPLFDAVPCIYNGEYGLWDKVKNTFLGNAAASGAFTGQ